MEGLDAAVRVEVDATGVSVRDVDIDLQVQAPVGGTSDEQDGEIGVIDVQGLGYERLAALGGTGLLSVR
jgi:hypothetical protein